MKSFAWGLVLLFSLFGQDAAGAPVTAQQATQAVSNWLARYGRPLLAADRTTSPAASPQADAAGAVLYYVVPLAGGGFVLAAGDDAIEPILAFSATGAYTGAAGSPLAFYASSDIAARLAVPQADRAASDVSGGGAKGKWDALLSDAAPAAADQRGGASSIASVLVAPLLETKWGQDNEADTPTYNLYTPTVTSGQRTLTGCVATAMAQLMRFHKHPTGSVGTSSQAIKVCQACANDTPGQCTSTTASIRGSDGAGGAYNYDLMPLAPDASTPLAQRQMISALMADAGATAHMDYATCFSGAWQWYAAEGLTSVFGYSNAVWNMGGPTGAYSMTADQYRMILNANLDAELPVLVTMSTAPSGSGHEVVADGYGFDGFTPYYHLNMGWSGQDDVWYNLPIVSTGSSKFNLIWTLIFNVYKTGTGEIISGRITDAAGAALSGVSVAAFPAVGGDGTTITTNANGIYALPGLASNTAYKLEATKAGWVFAPLYVATGRSNSPTGDIEGNITNFDRNACGNVWGADFAGTWTGVPASSAVDLLLLN